MEIRKEIEKLKQKLMPEELPEIYIFYDDGDGGYTMSGTGKHFSREEHRIFCENIEQDGAELLPQIINIIGVAPDELT